MKSYLQKHSKITYTDHYSTPKEIYQEYVLDKLYYDPCPLLGINFDFNHKIGGNVFLNPPYSDISKWIDWAIDNYKIHKSHHVILIPSRTDTKYFHKLLEEECELEFIKGRLKFGDSKGSAPFPSVLVHLR
jgi:hypothetical protein